MTLPDSEIKRINELYDDNHDNPFVANARSDKNYATKQEASLWYERMGKFAEWVVDNGWKRVNFLTRDVKWYNTEQRRQASHAELITEFLNQLNEGK